MDFISPLGITLYPLLFEGHTPKITCLSNILLFYREIINMDDILINRAEQEKFNSVVIQLLLEIESRQKASNLWLAHLASAQTGVETVEIVNRIESASTKMRIELVEKLYSQFGQIYPDILDLLKPKE